MTSHLRSANDLGAAIRDRRRKLGLNQQELATRVGVTRQWIIEIEQGKERAAIGLVLRTLNALGLELSALETAPEPNPRIETDIDAVVRRARKAK